MTTSKRVGVALFLIGGCALVWAAPEQRQPVSKTAVSASKVATAARVAIPCTVSGQVKADPSDKTNGFLHYKGEVTFKANVDLEGVNLGLAGPTYACTCVTCPQGSSHATGLKPEGKFTAGQSKSYAADCGSFPATQTISGPAGRGTIQYFVRTQGDAGLFKWGTCSGKFTFVN